jgi:hypothetical protein
MPASSLVHITCIQKEHVHGVRYCAWCRATALQYSLDEFATSKKSMIDKLYGFHL